MEDNLIITERSKKGSNFEEKIVTGIAIVLPLFLLILFDNLKSTGFAVVLSPETNFGIGLILWIILVVLVGAWGYIKLRRYFKR
jgi:hypothetical protein